MKKIDQYHQKKQEKIPSCNDIGLTKNTSKMSSYAQNNLSKSVSKNELQENSVISDQGFHYLLLNKFNINILGTKMKKIKLKLPLEIKHSNNTFLNS